MENIIVILIVGVAVLYLIRIFYKTTKKGDGCGCGCSSCDTVDDCDEPNFEQILSGSESQDNR
ncbi:MAG: FeoB-associated Cys-rich membrane protein [Deltaproteobacteria bacterium]|nr:MAG: FeoB-associated Cys-rich membrane protein [Deltaproteobacteria bacterium]